MGERADAMKDFMEIEGVATPADMDPGPSDDPDQRVEQLTNEIDETRGDLTQTIQAIGEKLEPGNLAREATDTVKEATLGKVEQMTYGAQETWRDVRTGNTGSIVDTIKSNPVPAGMVALGIGMLFMNRGSQGHRSRGYDRKAGSWQDARWDQQSQFQGGGSSPMDKVGNTVSSAGDAVGRVADDAGRKVSGVMEDVGQAASDLPQQAGMMVQQRTGQVRHFIDENPLGAGVIAMAAGAAIGMLLPTTSVERDTIGQARNDLIDKAESTAHQVLDKADEQVDKAQSEVTAEL